MKTSSGYLFKQLFFLWNLCLVLWTGTGQAEGYEFRQALNLLPEETRRTEITNARGIAVAPDGTVWVSVYDSVIGSCLQHFAEDGRFLAQSEPCDSSLGLPVFNPDGSFRRTKGSGVSYFNAQGEFIKEISYAWLVTNEKEWISDLLYSSDGSFWVLVKYEGPGINNWYTTRYSSAYHFSDQGTVTKVRSFSIDKALTIAPDGTFWSLSEYDSSGCQCSQLYHYQVDGTLIEKSKIFSTEPKVMKVAEDGSLWIVTRDRLLHLHPDGSLIAEFGASDDAPSQFFLVKDLAFGDDGAIWLADLGNSLIQKMTPDGRFQTFRSDAVRLSSPVVAVDGSLWFTDKINQKTLHYDSNGQLLEALSESEPCFNMSPFGIYLREVTTAPDKTLWQLEMHHHVLDSKKDENKACIRHFTEKGQLIKQFQSDFKSLYSSAGYGKGMTEFQSDLKKLYAAPDGSVWVVQNDLGVLAHFSAEGEKLAEIYGSDLAPDIGKTVYINGLFFANDFTIWITASTGQIRQLDTQGKLLKQFGSQGNSIDQFKNPSTIQVAGDNTVWIFDKGNRRIQHVNSEGQFIEQVLAGIPTRNYEFLDFAIGLDNSLWIKLDNGQIQKFTRQPLFDSTAEYFDYGNNWGYLIIHDVQIGNTHYQAEFGSYSWLNKTKFELKSFNFANNHYPVSADYNPETGILNLPQVSVDGVLYRATFRGKNPFSLLEATPISGNSN